ncbi:MAG: site-2 protease family protein [Leptolyngbyaceae cyanobacterium T60_A2020_046]|nr:site-2 protease family protein [Leptolyngbyaceae cyanobacterium T60_A2020_046]
MIFLLVLFGLITYYVVKRSVAGITNTPVWLLWLVMMTPALVMVYWVATQGPEAQFPLSWLIALVGGCSIAYWVLVQWGRKPGMPTPAEKIEAEMKAKATSVAQKKGTLRPIDKEEENTLQHCFPWSVFYLQNIEYRPQALICRGQLRSSPTVAYETVRENVESNFGDRFLVVFQEGLNGKPFFALVPNPQTQKKSAPPVTAKTARPTLALGLFLTTLFTTTAVGTYIAGVSEEALQNDPSLFFQGLPYAVALMLILGTHELGHYFTARRYRMQATLPYFIPIPFFLGTFGAFIQLRSPVPNRRALFDVGIAGPLAGLVMTLPLVLWGLAHSEIVPLSESASLLNFQALDPGASIAVALLSKLALGASLMADSAIALHPVAVSGCLGLVVTALNLMPVGQLDGGHIVHAMYGQRTGAIIGQVSRFLVLGLVVVHPELLIWAILLFFIPAVDEPALNDVSELDNCRDIWGLVALTILVLIVLPAPPMLKAILF